MKAIRTAHWAARGAVALALVLSAGCMEPVPGPGPQPGSRLPQVSLQRLDDGGAFSIASRGGGVLVVNFWATWCTPCREEMASLEALSRRFPPDQVQVIGVTMDTDLNLAREFVLQAGVTFPNYAETIRARARDVLGVRILPETLIVAPDGVLVARVTGARNWASADWISVLGALARGESFSLPKLLP